MAEFLKKVPELVAARKIRPNRVKLWEGGLDGINGGLHYMIEGKHSGEKIVHQVIKTA